MNDIIKNNIKKMDEIKNIYNSIKDEIHTRLNEFKDKWKNGNDKDIFAELVFCILTPQSKAKTCWKAVCSLVEKNYLLSDDRIKIAEIINPVRFKNNKAKYITLAKKSFFRDGKLLIKPIINKFKTNIELRDWLFENIKGIGLKESNHFARNIGLGQNIAILDRHILKNLKLLNVIDEIPKTINKKTYLDIEQKMIQFSKDIRIDMEYLDFVLWYKEAKEVFK
jgi:N-glycosylase/DNA lyase